MKDDSIKSVNEIEKNDQDESSSATPMSTAWFKEQREISKIENIKARQRKLLKQLYNESAEGRRANAIRRLRQAFSAKRNPPMPPGLREYLDYDDDDDTRK